MVRTRPLRFLLVTLFLVLAFPLLGARITVLHFNDYHEHITPFADKAFGTNQTAGLARLVGQLERHRDDGLVLVAGDVLQGTPYSTIFRGHASMGILARHVDCMVFGNHEFDYGLENLRSLVKLFSGRLFSSNVLDAEGSPLGKNRWFVRTIRGVKVGVFGLTTMETKVTTHPKNVEGLRFLDEKSTAREMVAILRKEGAALVIAVTHCGFEEDKALAAAVPGIDLVVGGHSHTRLENGFRVGGTLVVQAGEKGLDLGKVVLDYDTKAKRLVSAQATLVRIEPGMPADRDTAKRIETYRRQLDADLQRVFGRTSVELDGGRTTVRTRESNLANFITDSIREAAKVQLVFINGGSIRSGIRQGEIRAMDILKVWPFNNTIVTMRLRGEAVLRILARSAGIAPDEGGFMHVAAGLAYTIKNRRLDSATFLGRPIDPATWYTVATSDFLAAGGDHYAEFKNGTGLVATGIVISDVIVRAIQQARDIAPRADGRIRRL